MQDGCLQMGCRPSKAANTAAAMCMRSETDSDYIAQAIRKYYSISIQYKQVIPQVKYSKNKYFF